MTIGCRDGGVLVSLGMGDDFDQVDIGKGRLHGQEPVVVHEQLVVVEVVVVELSEVKGVANIAGWQQW